MRGFVHQLPTLWIIFTWNQCFSCEITSHVKYKVVMGLFFIFACVWKTSAGSSVFRQSWLILLLQIKNFYFKILLFRSAVVSDGIRDSASAEKFQGSEAFDPKFKGTFLFLNWWVDPYRSAEELCQTSKEESQTFFLNN